MVTFEADVVRGRVDLVALFQGGDPEINFMKVVLELGLVVGGVSPAGGDAADVQEGLLGSVGGDRQTGRAQAGQTHVPGKTEQSWFGGKNENKNVGQSNSVIFVHNLNHGDFIFRHYRCRCNTLQSLGAE